MPTAAERDELIQRHRDYARALVLDLCKRFPNYGQHDELISAGYEGLVSAASRFDATRGVLFTTFAYYRIRGSVLDYLRRTLGSDPYARARAAIEAALDDVIEETTVDPPRIEGEPAASAAAALETAFNAAAASFNLAACAEALLPESQRYSPADHAEMREAAEEVRDVLDLLPEKEQILLRAVYFTGDTIEEAGQRLGLSKSWASRLHARGLDMMRKKLSRRAR